MGGKRRIVATAMLHMQHQRQIQHLGLQIRKMPVRTEHHEKVLRHGQILVGMMDVKAAVLAVVVIGVIAVDSHQRQRADENQRLPEHIVKTGVQRFGVIGRQRQYATGQGVHYIAAGGLHNHVPGEILGQRAALGQCIGEFPQLCLIGQTAEQQ